MSATVTVLVELPLHAVGVANAGALGAELRVLWAVDQVRRKRVGVGKGAELAGLPREAFMALLGEHGVPVIDYDPRELVGEQVAGA